MKQTVYSGYTLWPEGLSIWPGRRLKWKWVELSSIHSEFVRHNNGLTIVTTFGFRDGRSHALQQARVFSFGTGPGRFSEVVAQAVAAAPAEAEIDDLSFEIAQYGPRAVRRQVFALDVRGNVDRLLQRARHHRIWLETKQARAALGMALEMDPSHGEVLAWRFRIESESGDKKHAHQAALDWSQRCPDLPDAQAARLQMRLVIDDTGAAEEANLWLARQPPHHELAHTLAAHHFRAGRHVEAAQQWRLAAEQAADSKTKIKAQELARYSQRMSDDPWFRHREKLKRWLTVAGASFVILVALGFQGLRIYEIATREERENQARQEQAKQMAQREESVRIMLAKTDREFTELTGRVLGDYAAVRARAEAGDPAAQLTLADMLSDGSRGAPKDPEAALTYLEKSAEQGHRAALLSLGQKLVEGDGMPKDPIRAAGLFERAAGLGSPRAAAELAELFEEGRGVSEDQIKARELYLQAAEQGYVYAMTRAGWMLEHGKGGAKDRSHALELYRRAADKESNWATNALVRILSADDSSALEREESMDWLKKGAKRGVPELRLSAAVMLLSGAWDEAELSAFGKQWLEEAAQQGQPGARPQLGFFYLLGLGVPQDFVRANAEFEKASSNDEKAAAILARNIAFGVGAPRDHARARQLFDALVDHDVRNWVAKYLEASAPVAPADDAPDYLHQEQPTYPLRLLRKGIGGSVTLQFAVTPDGFVENVEVLSATDPEFVPAARAAIALWRFKPIASDRIRKVILPMTFMPGKPSE